MIVEMNGVCNGINMMILINNLITGNIVMTKAES